MTPNGPLTIKDWQKAIADSPHLGHALIQNVEVDTYPGAARAGKASVTAFHAALSDTFTADPTTDICTFASANVPNTGTAVTVSNSGGGLPAGLTASTNYFVIKLSSTTFKLATNITNADASTAIDITTAGTGTQTVTSVDPGTIRQYAYDKTNSITFAQDSNGRVWYLSNGGTRYRLLNGNTLTNGVGNGIAVFKVSDGSAIYLFAFRNAFIDVVAVTNAAALGAPSWTNAWQTMNSGGGSNNSHYALVGQDNIVYFCDSNFIGSILEKAGSVFAPGTPATYTYNSQALDLPLGSLVYWLEELGVNLIASVSNDDKLYPWDRVSDSFGLPLPIGEFGGNKMKNIGNVLYILAGTRGNIYYSLGSYVRAFKTIPQYLTYNVASSPLANPVTWGGIAAENGNLLVGIGAQSGKSGVYRFKSDGSFTIDNYPSTGQANVTALFSLNDFYQMGYAGGADLMNSARYTNFEAVIQSGLFRVGSKTAKASYSQLEIQVGSPIAGNIRVGYRGATTGSFTTITTIVADTNNTSYQVDCGLINIENIQIQVEFDNGLDILEVRLNP